MKSKKLLKKIKELKNDKYFKRNYSDEKLFIRKSRGGYVDMWVITDYEMIKKANCCPNGDISYAVQYFSHDYAEYKYMGIDEIIYYLENYIEDGYKHVPYANQIKAYYEILSA